MPNVSLITLGVEDVERATRFYEALGWERSSSSVPGEIAFLRGGAVALGLFGREDLAEDGLVDPEPAGAHGNLSLAMNLGSPAAVDATLEQARAAGALVTKPGQEVSWGGYSGYFRDLDGHLWEVAHNPGWPLEDDGRVILPV